MKVYTVDDLPEIAARLGVEPLASEDVAKCALAIGTSGGRVYDVMGLVVALLDRCESLTRGRLRSHAPIMREQGS